MRANQKLVTAVFMLSFAALVSATAAAEENGDAENGDAENGDAEAPETGAPGQSSAEVKAAAGVEEREPVEEAERFEDGDRVFAWSRIENAEEEDVHHVWERNGAEVAEISIDVGGPTWRTWTRSAVSEGEYTVRVVGENDRELGAVSFEVE